MGIQLYNARFNVQGTLVDFSPHGEKVRRTRRKSATFYVVPTATTRQPVVVLVAMPAVGILASRTAGAILTIEATTMRLLPGSSPRPLRAASRAGWPLALLVIAQVVAFSARAWAQVTTCSFPRPQDQVWLVSCRAYCCWTADDAGEQLKYWRHDGKNWKSASLQELLAGDDPNLITVIHAHGNRISHEEAFESSWTAYTGLAGGADDRPIRFITWSWPSEAYQGLLEDARIKAARTGPAGYELAWFIDQLNPQAPLSLWGHSFGARVVTGALHLLGGGSLDGHALPKRVHPDRRLMEVVLLVAALDNDWLLPGHYHGQAMSQMATLLLVNNNCDLLLTHYHRLYGRRCSQEALGLNGLATWGVSGDELSKLSQIDACCQVGRRHEFVGYTCSPALMSRIRPSLLFVPPSEVSKAPQTAAVENNKRAMADK